MLQQLRNKLAYYNASKEIKKYIPQLANDSKNLHADELVNLIFSPKWERFFWIKQLPEEIKGLIREVEEQRPKIVVEVGTNMGGSLFLFTKVAAPDAHIISIDLPGGVGGGGYPNYREQFYRSFATPPQKLDLIREDSHLQTTKDQLVKLLNGKQIDFLFLDADHSYEGIKMDFEMYAPLVRIGGVVGFHDIKPTPPDNWKQVGVFWNEIKHKYPHRTYISDEAGWGGIGTLTIAGS